VTGVPDKPGIAARLFRELADRAVNVDMIVQNISTNGLADISFTVPRASLAESLDVTRRVGGDLDASEVTADSEVARVSVIGAGMKSQPGVTATMFETLAKEAINIEMISTSAIRISCMVREGLVEQAVQALHAAFGLDAGEA
jgi:aspartate kinase